MKYNIINNKKLIVVQSSLMAGVMFLTSCTQIKDSNQTNTESASSVIATSEINTTTETTLQNTSTPTPTPVVYDFSWKNEDSEDFAEYYTEVTGRSQTLRGYIVTYGFSDELNTILTEYVNEKYNTNYESIPFSKVSYFHTYVVFKDDGYKEIRNSYHDFCATCLYKFDSNIVFSNKLVMSYLYQNKIPLGTRIPIENFEALNIDDMYSFKGVTNMAETGTFDLGSYDSSYVYSNYDLYSVLQFNNIQIRELCNDERIKNLDILTNDPEFPQAAEAREIYNGFLREYYGFDNCPQFGELVTREQYIQIFGEEPLDLSYIPGAVVKDSEVKGSSKARYNDDINNYEIFMGSDPINNVLDR